MADFTYPNAGGVLGVAFSPRIFGCGINLCVFLYKSWPCFFILFICIYATNLCARMCVYFLSLHCQTVARA